MVFNMKVRVACDKRFKEYGSPEYTGGWHYYTVDDKQEVDLESRARWATYAGVITAVALRGHELCNAGWKHNMLSWNFTHLSLDGYAGWETEIADGVTVPGFVKLTHVRGDSGSDVESSALANAWDDIASTDFYQRDWTNDGIPFVNAGETYWSGWWFATLAERDRFVEWHRTYKGTPTNPEGG